MTVIFEVDFAELRRLRERSPCEKWNDDMNAALAKCATTWVRNGLANGVWFHEKRCCARFIYLPYSIEGLLPEEILFVWMLQFNQVLIRKSSEPCYVDNRLGAFHRAIFTCAESAIP